MVMSDQEWKQEQKPRAPDGFVVWLSSLSLSLSLSPAGSRLAGAPRFPMPSFHVRAHKAAVLIDGLERGLELLYRYMLLNKAEVLVER
jgi:hypothetical protein